MGPRSRPAAGPFGAEGRSGWSGGLLGVRTRGRDTRALRRWREAGSQASMRVSWFSHLQKHIWLNE